MRVVYYSSSETVSHLLLHCSAANYILNKLFEIIGENWVCPKDQHWFLLIKFRGFGFHKEAKLWWQCLVYGIL